MAPNAGDRHFRVFRVPASVFQVPVGGDGRRSLTSFVANGLRWMRSIAGPKSMPKTLQRIGVSEHDGRQAGAGPRSRNRPRAWERPDDSWERPSARRS